MPVSKELLKIVLTEQRFSILKRDTGIEREVLSEIGKKIKLPHVHILTGMRRCGKSTLLRQIIKKYYNDTDFYYVNFDDERFLNFDASDFNLIYETLTALFGKNTVFFIDEIQNVDKFETFVRRFYDQGFKFFITGSNATLLSKELGTRLTGRHIDTVVKPFSFNEFLKKSGYKTDTENLYLTENRVKIKKLFEEYLTRGVMPEYLFFDNDEILHQVYEDIVIKDIVVRHNVDNALLLKQLYQYLISNPGRKFRIILYQNCPIWLHEAPS